MSDAMSRLWPRKTASIADATDAADAADAADALVAERAASSSSPHLAT